MALKPTTPSAQLITFKAAIDVIAKLQSKGVPVSNMREILPTGQIVSTSDPNWFDDGTTSQYVATIWGADLELGLVVIQLGKGGFNNFLDLAVTAFETSVPTLTQENALNAILSLPGITASLDAALAL
jgi:hypothetical protein